ncbi:unnamed protein product [Lymnaea stagnalis]|uniref:Uncharacterized protein n=1 Tax=Lymnaea stagnalis TaxID=6523 RepID=A0AAV2HQH3_LYMST
MKSKQRWRVPFMIKKAFPKSQENDRKKKQTQMHMKPNDQIQMRSCQKTKTIFIGLAESETMMTKHKWAEFRIINYHNPNTHYQHVIDALINEPLSNLRWIDYSAYSLVENFTGKDIFAFVCGHRGCYFEKRPGTAGRSARPRTAKVGFPKGISEPGTSAQGISEPLTSAPGVPERGTSAQGISEPGISAQDISEPVTSDQGISEPRISAHGISKQGTSSQGKYDQDTPAQGKSEQA